MFPRIEQENLYAHYDPTKEMACVAVFSSSIGADLFPTLYQWLGELLDKQYAVHALLINFRYLRNFSKAIETNIIAPDSKHYEHLVDLPLIMIVDNSYQENKLNPLIQNIDQIPNKKIVQSYVAAFEYVDSFHKLDEVKQDTYSLSTRQASLWMPTDTYYTYIVYYGVVTAQATADIYGGMFSNLDMIGVENVKAGIFEFRHVSKFDNSNLQSVKRSSSTMNKNYDMSHIPVSLLAGNFHQEQMVRLAMKVSPQEERKKIVSSLDKAYQFIEEFNAKQQAKEANKLND